MKGMELVKKKLNELYRDTPEGENGEKAREILQVLNQMVVGMEQLDNRVKRVETVFENWSHQ